MALEFENVNIKLSGHKTNKVFFRNQKKILNQKWNLIELWIWRIVTPLITTDVQ